jgi:hypothetical protein
LIYLDLVYQWRQVAEEVEAIDQERSRLEHLHAREP